MANSVMIIGLEPVSQARDLLHRYPCRLGRLLASGSIAWFRRDSAVRVVPFVQVVSLFIEMHVRFRVWRLG